MEPHVTGYLEVNGIRLYHEIYGAGEPLVLIHGGAGSIQFDFRETIIRLQERFLLIGIDLQNHGRSDHREEPETFEQDAKDIVALLDLLGVPKASFFGFSNGATTALEIAKICPDRVVKIVAASGVYKRNGLIPGFFQAMEQATIDNMPTYLKESFLKLNSNIDELHNMFQKDSQRMIHFEDWKDRDMQHIKNPVLLIYGDRDVVTVTHAATISQLLPDARLCILPATHGGYMMADESGIVDEELITFTVSQIARFLE